MKRKYAGRSYPNAKRFAGARLAGAAIRSGARLAASAWRRAGGRGSISRRIRGAPRRIFNRVRRVFSRRGRRGTGARIPFAPNPGNELTVINKRLRFKRFKLSKVVNTNRNRLILRASGLTNFDTNQGWHPLANWRNPLTDEVTPPIHIYDLTSVPNNTISIPVGWKFNVAAASGNNAVSTPVSLNFTTPDGAAFTTDWQFEKGNAQPYRADSFHHDWTQVKLNLYGARKRTTYFDIMFVRFRDDFANLVRANPNNSHHRQLMHTLMRPLMYSNLYVHRPEVKKMMSIVRKYRYYVPATQTIDLNTTTGKIKNVNIFIRHNTKYRLDWVEGQTIPPLTGANCTDWITLRDDDNRNFPKESSQLFMIITAFAPEQRSGNDDYPIVDPAIDPSYDILLRNAVSMPRFTAQNAG